MDSIVNWVTLGPNPVRYEKWHDHASGVTHVLIERDWEPAKILEGTIDEIMRAAVIDIS